MASKGSAQPETTPPKAPNAAVQARRANQEAEAILKSLQLAGTAAIETTMDSIVEILRNDVPLMYHINGILQNETWRAVLRASLHGEQVQTPGQENPASGVQPAAEKWKLRTSCKTFDSLKATVERVHVARAAQLFLNLFQLFLVLVVSIILNLMHHPRPCIPCAHKSIYPILQLLRHAPWINEIH